MILFSLRSPLHCLQSATARTEGKACWGITTRRDGEFPVATVHGLACAEGAITLQGKGGNAGKQVMDVFGIFTDNSHFLLQAVASRLDLSQELKKEK